LNPSKSLGVRQKMYLWMMKYNIVVITFSFDFEGEMSYLVPLFVHETGCA
jgi:hypothetical protein